jgi:hypothetical protein
MQLKYRVFCLTAQWFWRQRILKFVTLAIFTLVTKVLIQNIMKLIVWFESHILTIINKTLCYKVMVQYYIMYK